MMFSSISIRCPICTQLAEFEFANYIELRHKSDLLYFKKSKHFDVVSREGWSKYKLYYHAIHYRGISPHLENIKNLPKHCAPKKWQQGVIYPNITLHKSLGTIRCNICKSISKYELTWPEEAFFQIEYKGKNLWAYDRNTAIQLLNYIKSNDRSKRVESSSENYVTQDYFLRKIPEQFQTAKARNEIVKKLRKILGL